MWLYFIQFQATFLWQCWAVCFRSISHPPHGLVQHILKLTRNFNKQKHPSKLHNVAKLRTIPSYISVTMLGVMFLSQTQAHFSFSPWAGTVLYNRILAGNCNKQINKSIIQSYIMWFYFIQLQWYTAITNLSYISVTMLGVMFLSQTQAHLSFYKK